MLKPFYQGKLDVFCAIYAVLNGLRLTHNIRTLRARQLFNDILMTYALKPKAWHAILNQETDYIPLVDNMLHIIGTKYPLEVMTPFHTKSPVNEKELWMVCYDWLNVNESSTLNRAIILRFTKYPSIGKALPVRHWTTVGKMTMDVMHLFDSSHEAESILHIHYSKLRLAGKDWQNSGESDPVLYIHPESLRLLRLPF